MIRGIVGCMKINKSRRVLITCGLCLLGVAPVWAASQSPAGSSAPSASSATAESPAIAPPSADDASYTIGLRMGQTLHQSGVTNEVSIDRIVQGLKDGLTGKKALPEDDLQLRAFLRSVLDAVTAKNAAAAKEFLQRNAKERGVKTLPSGLQYKIIEAGSAKGAAPQPSDRVIVQYRGTFVDGTEFDSSAKHPAAAPLAVNNVIRGWQEALGLMKPGAKWQLFVPPELGYGLHARPGIPGGSLLIFDIELKSIEPAPVKPQ